MPNTAQKRDPGRLRYRPVAGFGHDDKWDIMIRPGDRMNKCDRRCGQCQKIDILSRTTLLSDSQSKTSVDKILDFEENNVSKSATAKQKYVVSQT
jgi:hypothetical protein